MDLSSLPFEVVATILSHVPLKVSACLQWLVMVVSVVVWVG